MKRSRNNHVDSERLRRNGMDSIEAVDTASYDLSLFDVTYYLLLCRY